MYDHHFGRPIPSNLLPEHVRDLLIQASRKGEQGSLERRRAIEHATERARYLLPGKFKPESSK
jgi:hypothetical protein